MPKRPSSPGTPPPAARLAGQPRPSTPSVDEAAVDQEWTRIESDRVAEEVAEAREDLGDPAPAHPSARLWGGFAAALLAGVVFAAVVNVALAARRPPPAPSPAPVGFRPPSPNELGPGFNAEGADQQADQQEQPAETASPPTTQPSP
jgi:hypothetical protein